MCLRESVFERESEASKAKESLVSYMKNLTIPIILKEFVWK